MATTLVLKQQCSEFCVSRLLPFMEHSVWILNTCYMLFFIVLHFCPVWLCTNIWPHTHMELAHQGSYFNQRFRDEPAKSVGIKVHIKNCLSDWSIYFTGLHIIECMVKGKWKASWYSPKLDVVGS